MKIDRLIGIIMTLLQKEKVTAPELADKFEVSRRTINRDIEAICKAGIPVVTTQGSKGGISIVEGYKIDKTMFNAKELRAILTGLLSLDSVTQDAKYRNIMDKLGLDKKGVFGTSHLLIDLSSHYKGTLAPKIEAIQTALEQSCGLEFTYFNQTGERNITIDPYLILFQWSNWYVLGVDHGSNDFKLYKLNRLWQPKLTDRKYEEREIPQEKLAMNNYFTNTIKAVIIFDASVKHRLIEEYGVDCYTEYTDQKLRFESTFTNKEYLIQWVLGFDHHADLLEPVEIRAELKNRLKKMLAIYSET